MEEIKIGSHVGMAGKEMFLASVKEAERYGANVLMLYTGAPQNTRRKEIKDLNIEAGWEYAAKAGIKEIVVHAPYIINPANTVKPETFELAVLDSNEDNVFIALETMAGKGSEIGRTFEEIRAIYDGVHKKERLRVCFDTCHVNDAGYDLVHDYDGVFEKFDQVIGLDQIAVFHINDSLNPLGAHKDRHANIGKGTIGFEPLYRLVHDPRFVEIPKILETPWLCAEGETKKTIPPYKEEIAQLLAKE